MAAQIPVSRAHPHYHYYENNIKSYGNKKCDILLYENNSIKRSINFISVHALHNHY